MDWTGTIKNNETASGIFHFKSAQSDKLTEICVCVCVSAYTLTCTSPTDVPQAAGEGISVLSLCYYIRSPLFSLPHPSPLFPSTSSSPSFCLSSHPFYLSSPLLPSVCLHSLLHFFIHTFHYDYTLCDYVTRQINLNLNFLPLVSSLLPLLSSPLPPSTSPFLIISCSRFHVMQDKACT